MKHRRGSALTVQQLMLLFIAIVVIAVVARFTLFSSNKAGTESLNVIEGKECDVIKAMVCIDGKISEKEYEAVPKCPGIEIGDC